MGNTYGKAENCETEFELAADTVRPTEPIDKLACFAPAIKFNNELRELLGIPRSLWDSVPLPESGGDIVTWMEKHAETYPSCWSHLVCLFTIPQSTCGSLFTGKNDTYVPCWWSGFWIEKFATSVHFQKLINQICDPKFGTDRQLKNCPQWTPSQDANPQIHAVPLSAPPASRRASSGSSSEDESADESELMSRKEIFGTWTANHNTEPEAADYFPKLNMFASLLRLGGVALQVNVGMEYDMAVFGKRDALWDQRSEKGSYVRNQQHELGVAISTMYTTCAVRTYLVGQENNAWVQNPKHAPVPVERVSVLCYYIGNIAREIGQTTLGKLPTTFFYVTELPVLVRELQNSPGTQYQLCALYDATGANDGKKPRERRAICEGIRELLEKHVAELSGQSAVNLTVRVLDPQKRSREDDVPALGYIDVTRKDIYEFLTDQNSADPIPKTDVVLPYWEPGYDNIAAPPGSQEADTEKSHKRDVRKAWKALAKMVNSLAGFKQEGAVTTKLSGPPAAEQKAVEPSVAERKAPRSPEADRPGWAKDQRKRSPRVQGSDAMQRAVEHTEQQAQRRLDFKMLSERKKTHDQKGGKRKKRSKRRKKRRNRKKTIHVRNWRRRTRRRKKKTRRRRN